jgi:hypothetical protein
VGIDLPALPARAQICVHYLKHMQLADADDFPLQSFSFGGVTTTNAGSMQPTLLTFSERLASMTPGCDPTTYVTAYLPRHSPFGFQRRLDASRAE